MLRALAPPLAMVLLLLAPSATAHTTVGSSDGKYLITVGNLNEPVTTFTKTGLDLIIRTNQTARQPVTGVHLTLNATLIAPNGDELSEPLETRFGSPGSYTFGEPYYLTMPGEYFLRVDGRINETTVNIPRILVGSGPIPAYETRGFPHDTSSPLQLEQRIAMLEAKNEQLQDEVHALKDDGSGPANAPGADALSLLGIVGVAGLLFARSRRKA